MNTAKIRYINKKLTENNIILGYGAFGTTYAKNNSFKWVTKISFNDPAYLRFVRLSKQNQENIHFPKIKYYTHINYKHAMTVIEYLHKLTNKERASIRRITNCEYTEVFDISKPKNIFSNDICDRLQRSKVVGKYFTDYFLETLFYIEIVRNKSPYSNDIHVGNLMKRKNKDGSFTLVVTDPYFKPF